jgi:hypothetical protein
MTAPRIHPDSVFSLASATSTLNLRKETLTREIRLGRLQARRRAGRYWILGSWLIRWIETGQAHANWQAAEPEPAAAANGRHGRGGRKPCVNP